MLMIKKFGRALLLGILLLLAASAIVAFSLRHVLAQKLATDAEGFRTASWSELVPKGWDPTKAYRDIKPAQIKEGSAREQELMRDMKSTWDNAPTRAELDGAKLRLPGYVVPLDLADGQMKEFLLVPYFGACLHSPPPPANQLVLVRLREPAKLRTMDAVWVTGVLSTQRQDSLMGMSGYLMDAQRVQPYSDSKR